MATYSDIAICLRSTDFSEHSQIVTLLTADHGVVRLIGKGLKRSTRARVAVGIDLLELGRVSFSTGSAASEGRLGILREWRQEDIFADMRQDLAAMVAAQYAAEMLVAILPEADPYAELFGVLRKFLGHVGPGKGNLQALVRLMWLTLQHAGHLPQVERCGVCGKATDRRPTLFSPTAGGAVCRDCAPQSQDHVRLDAALGRALAAGRPELAAVSGFGLLNTCVVSIIGRPLRSTEAVKWALLRADRSPGTSQDARQGRPPAGPR